MSTRCLFTFLKLPSRLEHSVARSLLSGNSCRNLCSDLRWLSSQSALTDRINCTFSKVLFHHHRPLLEYGNQQGAVSQILFRYNSSKGKENHATNSNADSEKSQTDQDVDELEKFQKLSMYEKIKAMYRDYWYVLVPVHLASSCVFLGAFYYAASSGVDIIAILEALHVSETLTSSLKDSSAGYIAIAYALYKIATPVRYTVTLGGTTWAIRFLRTRGLIKPRRPMREAKENVQKIISAMKLPEKERQKFLEDKGLPRIGKAVGQASSAMSNLSNKSDKEK